MFSSPMSHFFRHALVSYKETSEGIKSKAAIQKKLAELETSLERLGKKNPGHLKVHLLLEKVKKMKAEVN